MPCGRPRKDRSDAAAIQQHKGNHIPLDARYSGHESDMQPTGKRRRIDVDSHGAQFGSAKFECVLDHTHAEKVLQITVKPKPQRRSEPISGRNPTYFILVVSRGKQVWLNAGPCPLGCASIYLYGRLATNKRSGLMEHIRRHHKSAAPYPCTEHECAHGGFFRPWDLERHKKIKHGGKGVAELQPGSRIAAR